MEIKRYDLLFMQYKSFLYQYASRLCKDSSSPEDLLQDTYLQGRKSIQQLREVHLLRRYLKTVMRNINCNRLRRNWSRSRTTPGKRFHRLKGDIADNRFRPDTYLTRMETTRQIHAALSSLPEKLRVPLILYNFQNKSYPAIAAMQCIPVGTVRSRIARGKVKLRKILTVNDKARDNLDLHKG